MHAFLFLFFFIVLCFLFRRQMRILVLTLLILFAVASIWTGSYWNDRYNHWVDCGRPQAGVCTE